MGGKRKERWSRLMNLNWPGSKACAPLRTNWLLGMGGEKGKFFAKEETQNLYSNQKLGVRASFFFELLAKTFPLLSVSFNNEEMGFNKNNAEPS